MTTNHQQTYSNLGETPFPIAYDYIYGQIEKSFKRDGHVKASLMGILFRDGQPNSATVMPIKSIEEVQINRPKMMNMFHMVVHISEAWSAPSNIPGVAPSQHPDAQEVVAVILYTTDAVCSAMCPINGKSKSIIKGELITLSGLGGNLKWDIPGSTAAS